MKTATLKISGDIGQFDPMLELFGFSGTMVGVKEVDEFLAANKDADKFIIEINSYGGSVDEALVMYDKLKAAGKPIETHGFKVASSATLLFLLGETRLLSENAPFIVHFPYISNPSGNFTSDDLYELAVEIENYNGKIVNIYTERLGLSDSEIEELKAVMKEDKDIGLSGAMEWGFATGKLNGSAVAGKGKPLAYTKHYLEILNKHKPKTNKQMSNFNVRKWVKSLLNVKAATAELEDGTTIYFEGETLEIGLAVFMDEALETPAPDGDHLLADGRTITTEGGVVTAIAEAPTTEELIEDMKAATEEIVNQFKKEITALKAENSKLKAAVAGSPIAGSSYTGVAGKKPEGTPSKFEGIKNRAKR